MNHLKSYKQDLTNRVFMAIFAPGVVSFAAYLITQNIDSINSFESILICAVLYIVTAFLAYTYIVRISFEPVEMVWQAIWHVSPNKSDFAPPKLDTLKLGRELVTSLVMQVYNLASSNPVALESEKDGAQRLDDKGVLENVPLAIFVLDKNWNIIQINMKASEYLELDKEKILNKNIHDSLHLSFSNDDTLDTWLNDSKKNRATDTHSWEHVKISLGNDKTKQFDMSAYYSKDDTNGNEVILALFEKSNEYTVQEQATTYVALAVHELRTPLTMLRGYIELFEEEIGEQLSEEHKEFMRKMSVTVQTLTAIVSNILNVSRIDEDQFMMTLRETKWEDSLKDIIANVELRAQVRGKNIRLDIEPNMPTVGVDKISMYEVVSNLIDNAIKYSGQSKDILVTSKLNSDGDIETVIEDKGPGMPENVVGGLFTKFYRSHKSRDVISGSGLGLYIVKSIITAHGGNVWVRSKEGEGSKFGFTLVPYANLKDEDKSGNNDGIERQANGWIKNHSFYRR